MSYLAKGNRSFFYPSVGASLIFTELIKIPSNILSYGKIRANWAQVGQAVPYTYGTQNYFIAGGAGSGFLNDGIVFPFHGVNAFSLSDVLRSPDLKPQTSNTTEFGIELRVLNSRIGLEYTYFNTIFEDQIFQVPIAASTGFQAELRNAGTLKSIGHEATLTLVPVQTKSLRWDVQINFTKYTNTVKKLAPGVSDIYLGGFTTPSIRALEGETYPSIYGIGYLRDDNGRIVLLDNPGSPYHGMPIADENSKKIGNVQPNFLLGFTTTITFKNIMVSALIDWKDGGEMYSGNNRLGRLYGILKVTEDRTTPVVLDGVKGYLDGNGDLVVTGDNDIAIVRGQSYWNDVLGEIDEAHVFETSFVRFRELSVGYSLPTKILSKTKVIKKVNLSFVARNLGLWTSYPNFDPETSTTGAVNGQGLEYVAFPQTSSFGGKIDITF